MQMLWTLLLLAIPSSSFPGPIAEATHAAVPPVVRGDDRVDDLVERIEGLTGWKKARAIEDLAALKSKAAFEAHAELADDLRGDQIRARVMRAFLCYRDVEGVSARAVAYLSKRSGSGKEPVRRAAAEGLALYGGVAEAELRQLAKRSKDARVRALALGGLREVLTRSGAVGDLELFLEGAVPGPTGSREQLRAVLDAYTGEPAEELLAATLRRGRGRAGVRAVVCESLEPRRSEASTEGLLAALRDEVGEVRLAALRALESRAEPTLAQRLPKLLVDPYEPVRREAVIQLGVLRGARPEGARELLELAADRDPGVRQGAAVALSRLGTPQALAMLEDLLDDPDHLVQREALLQLGARRNRATVGALLDHLPTARGRHRFDLLRVLRLLTGVDHGATAQRWVRWWQAEGPSFTLPSYEEALEKEKARKQRREEGATSSTFFGLQVISDRVAFVMDVSGSMSELSGGQRRIDAAKEQLIGALERYPEGGLFNLLFFSSGVDSWSDEAVEMDRRSREEALEYTVRQKPGGATAVFTALELAFEDREVDTIYLLTDGVPSAGRITDAARIREEVRRWNESRGVVIHGIAVGMKSPLLEGLAEDTGGNYTFVR